ncbi:MAG: hypothetical protein ACOCZV_00825 [Nanoarchaeota archaeon]
MASQLLKIIRQSIETLNPNKYDKISEKLFSHSLNLFFKVFLLGVVIMMLLFIPKVTTVRDSLKEDLDSFTTAQASIDFTTTEPVSLLSHPPIMVDSNATSRGDSFLVIGNESLFYRNYIFWGSENATISNEIDLKENSEKVSLLVNTIAVILFPGIIISISLCILLLTSVLNLLVSFAGYLIVRTKKKISFRDSLVISIHSMLIPLLGLFALIAVGAYLWTALLLYLLLFVISMSLVKGYTFHGKGESSLSTKNSSGKKADKKRKRSKRKNQGAEEEEYEQL